MIAGISALVVILLGGGAWWATHQATAGSLAAAAQAPARLWVTTDPTGAQVAVDGELLGASPVDAATIRGGKHTLTARLLKTGIERSDVFEVDSGGEARRNIAFPKGSLMVLVKPWGKVFVDHALAGETPFPPLALVAGRHVVEVVGPAGEVTSRNVEVHSGQEERLVIDLTVKKGR